MRWVAAILGLLTACGRFGFNGGQGSSDADQGVPKPDGEVSIDGDPTIDAAFGTGDYGVTDTTMPYTLLQSPTPVPGVVGGADDEILMLPYRSRSRLRIAYNQVGVGVNGYLTFGAPPSGADNYTNDCPFDATPPDATIALFWDDLYASPTQTPLGSIGYAESGSAPDRVVEIEWRDMDAFYNAGSGGNNFTQLLRITQKVVLHETGVIELHYGPRTPPGRDHDCGLERHLGCSATVGLEAPGGLLGKLVQCGTSTGPKITYAPLVDGRLITFTPQ